MLLAHGEVRSLGVEPPSLLAFGEEPKAKGVWAGRRLLSLNGKPAFELSFWCGTCQYLFRRLDGANETMSIDALEDNLALGLNGLDDDVIDTFASMLPRGDYLPLLLTMTPRMASPAGPGDYFAEEQIATWGLDAFWGLPIYPSTPYYRTFETRVSDDAHLFEFVVPMVPPSWNEATKVALHSQRLQQSSLPTAVAVSTLDICQPAMDNQSNDYYAHWGLTHFLLDGHHKMQAAADLGQPLRLLSLLSTDASLAGAEQIARLPILRAREAARRGHLRP
ncbi:MAG TPA: hypothetical protein VHZ96_14595 [Frankiaceae bacterium]|nr:hypothetical protein [Frankiaceae bacterium]